MQDAPLTVARMLRSGSSVHADARVATWTGTSARYRSYGTLAGRCARLAHALRALGVTGDQRVGTFMWNNAEHLEAYFAVPAMGAVLHTINLRFSRHQLIYTINHAEDRVILVNETTLPRFAELLPELPTVEHVVVVGSGQSTSLRSKGKLTHDYEELLAAQPEVHAWADPDERSAAALCYTSGTTGEPKGVAYSHRSIYLHAFGIALPEAFDLSARDRILPVVPQFHVLAWGLPYAAFLTGASLPMPDRYLAAARLAEFIAAARPNKAAGVPTIWQALLNHLDGTPDADVSSLKEAIVGGSA